MPLPLRRIGTPASEPVSLAAMKAHLNLEDDFTDDDDLIAGIISAAREDAESFTGRSLATQQWIYALDYFPLRRANDFAPSRSDFDAFGNFNGFRINNSQVVTIPQPPLLSLDSLQYIDLSGVLQTLAPSAYQVDTVSEPGRLAPSTGTSWPATGMALNAVQITFTSGYTNLPYRTLQAIKLRAAAYYANREEFIAGIPQAAPDWFERMLNLDRTSIFGFVGR